MKKSKNTKRALLTSVLSLVLCCAMFIGSTFAWFTDSATTGVNKITAGNLDIKLEYSTTMNGTDWQNAQDAQNIFESVLWEPGHTQVVYFKVSNVGSLAVKYSVATNIVKETAGINQLGGEFELSEYLKFGIVECTAAYADRTAAREAITVPYEFSAVSAGNQVLEANNYATFAMVVWMPEDTGNVANHNGTNIPEIQFGINVIAGQYTLEEDSFDETYDANAAYPSRPKLDEIVAEPKTAADLKTILDTAFTGGSATGTITINLTDDFDLKNEWTTAVSANYSGVNTVVINGNGHSITNMNQPLIEGTFGGAGTLTFQNLTIKDSKISVAGGSDTGIGVFMNNADTSTGVTFVNCNIDNVQITNTADNSYLGGFVGYSSADTLTFTNCSVKNSTFIGTKDIGAFVGYTSSAVTATDVVITGNTINSSNNSTYRVGAVAGTFNVNASTITTTNVSNNTITQTGANTVKISDYAGRILAEVTVDGNNLTKNN